MDWKGIVADYLSFTRRDRIAILVVVLVILAVFFLPDFFPSGASSKPVDTDTSWITSLKKLEQKEGADKNRSSAAYNDDPSGYQYDRAKKGYHPAVKGALFYFDPNTLSAEGWEKLGLRSKTIRTIQHYLSKGGKFRKAEDMKKVYGLFPDEYERMAPYIRIAAGNNPVAEASHAPEENRPVKTYAPRYASIDINTADTTAFISLQGIGSKLSVRIVNFRDKLGGFYSINQVAETFGLPDSTFQKIKQYLKLENGAVRQININNATVEELKAHPYIRYSIANPIVAYRKEHGPFATLDGIKKVMAVTEEVYNKISPYLTTQ